MGITEAVKKIAGIHQIRLCHDFQPGTIGKGQKIGTKIGFFIVIALIGYRMKIGFKETLCPFQIIDV